MTNATTTINENEAYVFIRIYLAANSELKYLDTKAIVPTLSNEKKN
ncbi:hypothetical protein ESCOMM224M_17590 [Escherichia coli]|nr:hypothetical protein [Escherichia coli]GKL64392.1 hypothetical protein NUKP61_48860 [Klebsiella variicola]EJK5613583.1 hypothetical protein [Escherichia coli]EKV3948980.1 hypothetical protein [Escherichia coli]NJS50519.1 hypothetical protein [Escherichia coli]